MEFCVQHKQEWEDFFQVKFFILFLEHLGKEFVLKFNKKKNLAEILYCVMPFFDGLLANVLISKKKKALKWDINVCKDKFQFEYPRRNP